MVQVIDQLKESLADLKKQLAFVRNMLIKVMMKLKFINKYDCNSLDFYLYRLV